MGQPRFWVVQPYKRHTPRVIFGEHLHQPKVGEAFHAPTETWHLIFRACLLHRLLIGSKSRLARLADVELFFFTKEGSSLHFRLNHCNLQTVPRAHQPFHPSLWGWFKGTPKGHR